MNGCTIDDIMNDKELHSRYQKFKSDYAKDVKSNMTKATTSSSLEQRVNQLKKDGIHQVSVPTEEELRQRFMTLTDRTGYDAHGIGHYKPNKQKEMQEEDNLIEQVMAQLERERTKEEEEIENIINQIRDEVKLEKLHTEDEVNERKQRSRSNSISSITSVHSHVSSLSNICDICGEMAVLQCISCENDVYCASCFKKTHTEAHAFFKHHKTTEL